MLRRAITLMIFLVVVLIGSTLLIVFPMAFCVVADGLRYITHGSLGKKTERLFNVWMDIDLDMIERFVFRKENDA